MYAEMTRKDQLEVAFWDMYKEAHGFRPRHIRLDLCSAAEIEQDLDRLQIIINDNAVLRRAAEEQASFDFTARIQSLMKMGARDYEMALRWIHEAEETQGDEDYLAYTLGLPYRYFAKKEVAYG